MQIWGQLNIGMDGIFWNCLFKKNGIGIDKFDVDMELSGIGIDKMELTPCLVCFM